jgi:hypothetical protein
MALKKAKATHPVQFRIASLRWLANEWFSHKVGNDIEVLDLQASEIRRQDDPYSQRQWEVQSSVDNGKTWQTQRRVH